MVRTVGWAGGAFLVVYVVLSLVTAQRLVALGDIAQLIPPLAYGGLTAWLARKSVGQARVFWNLNAIHGVIWAGGQVVWTYYDLVRGAVPQISPTDPIFFVSSIPLAAALYGRPERDQPRWLFNIVLLDLILIALFSAFLYIYFVASVAITDGPAENYTRNLAQLLNVRNLLLASWAIWVWRSTTSLAWKPVLGIYALGLAVSFVGGIGYDLVERFGTYTAGAVFDIVWMLPYIVMGLAAATAYDRRLFEPDQEAPPLARLPVVSVIAIALFIAIPAIDEIARRLLNAPAATESMRTRLALTALIPFGMVVVVREVLSRRALIRAGQELLFTREQLSQKEKLAAVGQLVSGIAHELNNPLQAVLGYAELILATRPPASEAEELRAIRHNAHRAAGIVRNLLAFAGRSGSTRGWHQVNRIVRDAVGMRQLQRDDADIRIKIETAERLPLAYIDSARIEDVVINLIQNAEAAVAAAGRKPGEIVVITRLDGPSDRIVIEVADNGTGLRQADLHRVFEPFFTTREVGKGTGLGLSVCYGIVREHGGQITVRNRERGGAVFAVELPVMSESLITATAVAGSAAAGLLRATTPAPEYSVAAAPDRQIDPSPRRRIALVVDDEESNAALVRRVLSSAGYEVESTTLSRRALVMIERTAYDAVISDVKMPELSGQDLYIRSCQFRPEMARRFIFITGDIDGEETRRFLEDTGCSYFMKPFNLDRLTAAVDHITGKPTADTIA